MPPPAGLKHAHVSQNYVIEEALREVRPRLMGASSHKSSSSTKFEIGWSFAEAEQNGRRAQAHRIENFPATQMLIQQSYKELGEGVPSSPEHQLNVIVRRYCKGQGIPMHTDRIYMFTEPVFGCVLINTSEQGLTWRQGDNIFKLPESPPGVVFVQRGEARYKWQHGVPKLRTGERISITWRWFARDGGEMQSRMSHIPSPTTSLPIHGSQFLKPSATYRKSDEDVFLQSATGRILGHSMEGNGLFQMEKKWAHLVVHCKNAPFDVYIGRNCRGAKQLTMQIGNKNQRQLQQRIHVDCHWGNPFKVEHSSLKSKRIKSYQHWLLCQPSLVSRARAELRGKVLACWCAPHWCHGHTLAAVANSVEPPQELLEKLNRFCPTVPTPPDPPFLSSETIKTGSSRSRSSSKGQGAVGASTAHELTGACTKLKPEAIVTTALSRSTVARRKARQQGCPWAI